MDSKIGSKINQLIMALLAVSMSISAVPAEEKHLSGHVEAKGNYLHIERPVYMQPSFKEENPKSEDDNSKHLVDVNSFLLKNDLQKTQQTDNAAIKPPIDPDKSHELTIAWEQWHKKVTKALYDRWTQTEAVYGSAKVDISVTKNKTISFDIFEFTLPEFMQDIDLSESEEVKAKFVSSIQKIIDSVNGQDILAFPAKSERGEVGLHATFRANMSAGDGGYVWRKDDFEHVKTP